MAQFFALLARDVDRFTNEDFAPLLEPEAERVRELFGQGIIRAAWSRGDAPGALLLFESDSIEAVRGAIETLPLYRREMLILEHLIPATGYRGFGPRQ